MLPGFAYAPFDDLNAALDLVDDSTAGFLLEPVQGEGGIRPASQPFLQGLRDICNERDLMLVFDEVQCGVARTGSLYAYEQFGVAPDIMAVSYTHLDVYKRQVAIRSSASSDRSFEASWRGVPSSSSATA